MNSSTLLATRTPFAGLNPAASKRRPTHRWPRSPTTPVWSASEIHPPQIGPYDGSVAIHLRSGDLRRQCGAKSPPLGKPAKAPAASQPYDQNTAIGPQSTMPLRSGAPKPYDGSSAKSTMPKKFVTAILCIWRGRPSVGANVIGQRCGSISCQVTAPNSIPTNASTKTSKPTPWAAPDPSTARR